jgi:hypothetical protein
MPREKSGFYYPPCRTYFLLMYLIALMTHCFVYNVTITTTHRHCEGYHACDKGNNKITELRAILQRESQNS